MTTTTPPPLTPRQASVLRAIQQAIATRGFAPTVSEIGAADGLSFARCRVVLHALERKGYIRRARQDGRSLSRAIEVLVSAPPLEPTRSE